MLRFGLSALALMLMLAGATNAQASALSLLTFDGIPDLLEDDDYESFVDAAGVNPDGSINAIPDGKIGVGDFVVGMFYFQLINGTPTATAGSTFEGILVAKVTGISGPTKTFAGKTFLGSSMTFGAVSFAEYTSAALQGGTWSNLPTRNDDDSALIVYDDAGGFPFVDPNGVGAGAVGANDALLTAQDGNYQFELGFEGNAYASAEIGTLGLQFVLALNETDNPTSRTFLPVDPLGTGIATDVFASGGTDFINPKGDFDVKTDADLIVNLVPEPGSMTLFGLGALGLLGARLRRKNAA